MNRREQTKRLVLSAMLLALAMVLPFLTGQIKEIGDSLLPMHIPVLLCGLLCGWQYGLIVGALTPILRSLTFGMPPLYPNAIWMAAELAAYGLMIGLVFSLMRKKNLFSVYVSLVTAMLFGRVVWGLVKWLLMGIAGKSFTLAMFMAGGFADALPGIILQLILIPAVYVTVKKLQKGDK